MSIAKTAIDSVYAYRFIRLMQKNFDQWKAFELGLIDNKGNLIKRPKTDDEKQAYTPFHASIRTLKRTLATVPGVTGWSVLQSSLSAIGSRYSLTEGDWSLIKKELADHAIIEMIAGDAGDGSGSPKSIASGVTTGDITTTGGAPIPAKRKRKIVGKIN